MRRPLVAGNWKMHGTHSSVAELIKGLRQLALPSGVDVAVMPPCLFISQVIQGLAGKAIDVGAQNSAVEPMQGALTGETAPSQLADVGCSMVLVGHSERRLILGESDEVVSPQVCRGSVVRPGAGAVCQGDPGGARGGQDAGGCRKAAGKRDRRVGCWSFCSCSRGLRAGLGDRDRVDRVPAQAQEVHAAIRAQLAAENAEVAKVCDSFTAAV